MLTVSSDDTGLRRNGTIGLRSFLARRNADGHDDSHR